MRKSSRESLSQNRDRKSATLARLTSLQCATERPRVCLMTKGRKSPTAQRLKSPLVRSKVDGLHRAQRLKGLHFSDDLYVSRVHNARTRPRARKAAKSIAVDKVEVYAYRKPACKSYNCYATLASLLKRLTAQKSPYMTERLTTLPRAKDWEVCK